MKIPTTQFLVTLTHTHTHTKTHTLTTDQPRPNMKRTSYLSYKFILQGGSKKGQPVALQLLNLGQSLELGNPLLEFSMIQ